MRGFPKHFNTPADIDNCMQLFPKETATAMQSLMDGRYTWEQKKKLADKDVAIEDADHKVVTIQSGSVEERWQYERSEDPRARFFALDLKVEDVQACLESMGAEATANVGDDLLASGIDTEVKTP